MVKSTNIASSLLNSYHEYNTHCKLMKISLLEQGNLPAMPGKIPSLVGAYRMPLVQHTSLVPPAKTPVEDGTILYVTAIYSSNKQNMRGFQYMNRYVISILLITIGNTDH